MVSPLVEIVGGVMNGGNSNRVRTPVLLRSVEDLADAKQLLSAIAAALERTPIDEPALRCAVWSFVGTERRAGVPPALVITRLTGLVDAATIVPISARLALTRRVILWCVEEYFGRLGGDVLTSGTMVTQDTQDNPVDGSGAVTRAPASP
jgi:hypothetical protein